MSSASPITRADFVPRAGSSSKSVTTGPGLMSRTSPLTPKSASTSSRSRALPRNTVWVNSGPCLAAAGRFSMLIVGFLYCGSAPRRNQEPAEQASIRGFFLPFAERVPPSRTSAAARHPAQTARQCRGLPIGRCPVETVFACPRLRPAEPSRLVPMRRRGCVARQRGRGGPSARGRLRVCAAVGPRAEDG